MMPKPKRYTRRQFLHASAAGLAAGKAVAVHRGFSFSLSASETLRLALIGCSGQGVYDLQECLKAPDTKVVALCDVDQSQLNKALKRVGGLDQKIDAYGDFRRIIDRQDIDAVIIATPDHWHAIPALQAMQSGKDVYLEKPIGHTIHEGQLMVEAARERQRIVQVGLQQRSGTIFAEAMKLVHSGQIGKVSLVHCWNAWNDKVNYTGNYRQLKNAKDGNPPDGVDYEMWLGPAPKRPFNPDRYNGTYLYYWDYSGGMVITWGVHLIDTVMQMMNVKGPSGVAVSGGRYIFDDSRDTPDTLEAIFDFQGFTLTYSCRHANAFPSGSLTRGGRTDHGIQFFGTEATLLVDRSGYQIIPEGKNSEPIFSPQGLDGGGGTHQRNFIECLRSRRQPVCDLVVGHRSTTTMQLANIAYRTGHKIRWDVDQEQIINDPDATRLMIKEYRAPWSLA
jgi:predicted dehydrogenase